MTDPLSITAGIVGLLGFAGSILTKGYGIIRLLQDSGKDVQKLLVELSQLTGILVAIESQGKDSKPKTVPNRTNAASISEVVDSSVIECRKVLERIWDILHKLEKSRRAVLTVKWQFLESDVKKSILEIEHYKTVFILCLGIDTRIQTDEILDLQKAISVQLQDMRDKQREQALTALDEKARANRRALFHWLVPKSDESHAKALKLRTPGTGLWVMTNEQFKSWSEGPNSLLWVNGIPGSGKSVLMSSVVEHIKPLSYVSDLPTGLAYFYCSYAESEKCELSQILYSLAAQLIRFFPEPEKGPAMQLFKDSDDGTLIASVERMQNLLIHMMNGMETAFVCLDAVDECKANTKSEILQFVFEVVAQCECAKILISSRTGDSEISEALDGCPSITISPCAIAQDIEMYVRHRLHHSPKRLRMTQSDVLINKLISGADGMFLWVSCQMDQLFRLRTTAGIQTAMETLPRGLFATYNRILEAIPPEYKNFAIEALRWLSHAAVPLNLDEVVEAIAINENSTSLADLDKLLIPEEIFQICGSLIRRSDTTRLMNLAHSSVYEYLTNPNLRTNSPSPYYLPRGPSNIVLAKACIRYLSFNDFSLTHTMERINPKADLGDALDIPKASSDCDRAFLDYALRNWWKHLPTTREALDEVWPHVLSFFETETENFEALVMLLHHVESTYRYPLAMQPVHLFATYGLHMIIDCMLKNTSVQIQLKVEDGRTALHMAAENNHESVVRQLLDHGADARAVSTDGRTPIQLALESGNEEIARLILRSGADANAAFVTGETPLSVAIGNNSASFVRLLLSEKADPNARLPDGRTPLHIAAEIACDIDIFTLLDQNGADPTLGDEGLWTPLHQAAYWGHGEAVLMLMKHRKVSRIFERMGWTPLHAAVQQEHTEIIRLFIGYAERVSRLSFSQMPLGQPMPSAKPISTQTSSSGPVSWKAQEPATSTIPSSLINSGHVPSSSQGSSRDPSSSSLTKSNAPTPLCLATLQGFVEAIDILLEGGAVSKDVDACIQLALTNRQTVILEKLIFRSRQNFEDSTMVFIQESLADLNLQDEFEPIFRSFHWNIDHIPIAMKFAIKERYPDLLEHLIARLSEFDDQNRDQITNDFMDAIHTAVECDNARAVELLHATGIDISDSNLLHLAAQVPHTDILEFLLKSLSANVVDERGRTPLHYAAERRKKRRNRTSILLAAGANPCVPDDSGWTPLHMAARHGSDVAVSMLLAAGAEVDALDISWMTPLHHCGVLLSSFKEFPSPTVSLLLEAGASITALNEAGYTPFQVALMTSIEESHPHSLTSILQYQPELVHIRLPPFKWTALHLAAKADCGSNVLDVLYLGGADLEAEDKDGKTPVQVAGDNAKRLLISRGALWKE